MRWGFSVVLNTGAMASDLIWGLPSSSSSKFARCSIISRLTCCWAGFCPSAELVRMQKMREPTLNLNKSYQLDDRPMNRSILLKALSGNKQSSNFLDALYHSAGGGGVQSQASHSGEILCSERTLKIKSRHTVFGCQTLFISLFASATGTPS